MIKNRKSVQVKYRCLRSFIVGSVVVSVVIILQLLLFEEDSSASDAKSFLLDNHAYIGDEHNWNQQIVIKSALSICPNCTFTDTSNNSQTSVNDTEPKQDGPYSHLRQYVRQLNHAPIVQNLDKFDMPTDNEGSLVIVVQVRSCSFIASLTSLAV